MLHDSTQYREYNVDDIFSSGLNTRVGASTRARLSRWTDLIVAVSAESVLEDVATCKFLNNFFVTGIVSIYHQVAGRNNGVGFARGQ